MPEKETLSPSSPASRQPEDAGRTSGPKSGNRLLCAEQHPRPIDPPGDARESQGRGKEVRLPAKPDCPVSPGPEDTDDRDTASGTGGRISLPGSEWCGGFSDAGGLLFLTAHHRHRKDLVAEYPRLLQARGVDGILAIDTQLQEALPAPTVNVAGHTAVPGVTNVILDHHRAAELALGHLYRLGHRKIAYMHGQPFSSDSQSRWQAIMEVARALSLDMPPDLIIQLDRDLNTPELGYPGVHQLLLRRRDFTAVLCFNDVSAIGSIRALHDAGLKVPTDVSVLGFDDIQAASYIVPSLTTIRQPLQHMGSLAASSLLKKLAHEKLPDTIKVDPELIVRESTAQARSTPRRAGS